MKRALGIELGHFLIWTRVIVLDKRRRLRLYLWWAHMLGITAILLGMHLLADHRDLAHVRGCGMRIGKSWAACCLVRRIRERRRHWPLLRLVLGSHITSATRLIGRTTEIWPRRIAHLWRIRGTISASTSPSLLWVATSSGSGTHAGVAQVTVCGL